MNCRLRGLFVATALLATQLTIAAEQDLPWAFNAPRAEGYTIDLTAVDPKPGTPLVRGETIKFTATVAYALDIAPKGVVILVFQDEKNQSLVGDRPQITHEVAKGSGTITLTDSIVVPSKAKEVRLFIPLIPDGVETTTGEVTLRWPIVKSAK